MDYLNLSRYWHRLSRIAESIIFEIHLGLLIKQGLFDTFMRVQEGENYRVRVSLWKGRVGVSP